ncbi:mitochondrial uncoupling protein 3-like [Mizuhopecten yessoensis]|uniref:Mitochondrial uncoupling protein 3 n=1 Tax=Mizuhopecten yessoensis TaxID=6573 RepID=A0A210QN73_MIZYE|nr:mitochondrial uncoupling protein 3-like [Mizuhopecten yessoensis]OWF50193.1 Mitochondrial uncoupling protein 3 [Mizuhopecten yessoensis]
MSLSKETQPGLVKNLACAGTAACIADCLTFPLDTAKVILQVQGENMSVVSSGAPRYHGVFGTIRTIAREEGARRLYSGLVPGLHRQMCFSSIRLGGYDEVKKQYKGLIYNDINKKDNLFIRISSAITTGSVCVWFAQPTDVVKVRMQAQSKGVPNRYSGCIDAYRTIAKQEGVRHGLWKGVLPNTARTSIINVGEIVTYDMLKTNIISRNLLSDSLPCHFVAAFGAGFCATVVASPVDVIKTRFMNAEEGRYKGALDCAIKMFNENGFRTFYKGFTPSFIRLGSWNVATFVCYEQIKRLALEPRSTLRVSPLAKAHCDVNETRVQHFAQTE